MSFNPVKPLIHNIQELFLNNIQTEKQQKDEEQECLQFGICAVHEQSPRPEELYFGWKQIQQYANSRIFLINSPKSSKFSF